MRKTNLVFALTLTLLSFNALAQTTVIDTNNGGPKGGSPIMGNPTVVSQLRQRIIDDIVKWSMPAVSFFNNLDALNADFGVNTGTTVYWSKPFGSEVKILTPNDTSLYFTTQLDMSDGKPQTIIIPPNDESGLTIFGSIMNAWQTPIEDVGYRGWDQGHGATYFITPPGWKGDVPKGVVHRESNTFNIVAGFRVTPKSFSDENLSAAAAYGKTMLIGSTPRFVDVVGMGHDPRIKYDERFFKQLQRVVDTEPALPHDSRFYQLMKQVGIEKGVKVKVTDEMLASLQRVKAELKEYSRESMGFYIFPDSNWQLPIDLITEGGTQFTYLLGNEYDWKRRAFTFHWAIWGPKYLGESTFYTVAQFDAKIDILNGECTYKFSVPANVPVRQFWSVTAYNMEDFTFFDNTSTVAVNSLQSDIEENSDGTTDVYFGPKLPKGKNKGNWIPTQKGTEWMSLFRWYGPQPELFNGSWTMGNIQKLDC